MIVVLMKIPFVKTFDCSMTMFVCLLINSMIINVKAIEVTYLKKQTVSSVFHMSSGLYQESTIIDTIHSQFLLEHQHNLQSFA